MGANPSVVQTIKEFTEIYPKGITVSMKPIQIPSAPIKPREYLTHYQVGT